MDEATDTQVVETQPTEQSTPPNAQTAEVPVELTGEVTEETKAEEKSEALVEMGVEETQQPETSVGYDFSKVELPEGMTLDDNVTGAFTEVAMKHGISQEAAFDIMQKVAPMLDQRNADRMEALKREWSKDLRADKEFGGAHLKENMSYANKALKTFCNEGAMKYLQMSGATANPDMIKMFAAIGKALSSDHTAVKASPATKKVDPLVALYSNSNMN